MSQKLLDEPFSRRFGGTVVVDVGEVGHVFQQGRLDLPVADHSRLRFRRGFPASDMQAVQLPIIRDVEQYHL